MIVFTNNKLKFLVEFAYSTAEKLEKRLQLQKSVTIKKELLLAKTHSNNSKIAEKINKNLIF